MLNKKIFHVLFGGPKKYVKYFILNSVEQGDLSVVENVPKSIFLHVAISQHVGQPGFWQNSVVSSVFFIARLGLVGICMRDGNF